MTDVALRQTPNNGDICVTGGVVELDGGLETAAYLSLFNGADWWGDVLETDPVRQYPSETEQALAGLPATTGNLRRISEAVKADLQWMTTTGVATSVDASATMPGRGQIRITVTINAEGEPQEFQFLQNWVDAI